ncbi:MAG: hypothetical protein OEU09_07500 [Rhodospirillales bacterium]|nr:hypothetical protein [Rhodospirillales bacterium]MDH3792377.1 hypothetical protein [Rhodospirillales bacterium]MDH3911126.1 hypothetical protein [Rhodospirillales bacterium]MDH3918121.1 hypothetical protein [Rhodospirillales bacterium]MDH3967078.1 hypothetical protein [Rhodospirillales bacterium]
MSDPYVVRPLAADQVPQAYPLVAIFDPKLTQEQWSKYAGTLISEHADRERHSIITVQSSQGDIYGLSVYWLRPDLREGRILEIENFAVVDLVGNRTAARVLLEALQDVALQLDCSCISISLLNPQMRKWLREPKNPAMDLFRASGFRGEQLRLRKCF